MAIQVISNAEPVAEPKPAEGQAVESKSVSAANAAEQKPEGVDASEQEEDAEDHDAVDKSETPEAKDDEAGKPKKKSGAQRRKERAERAEAEVARLQRLMEEMALKGAGESKEAKPEANAKPKDGKPNPDDFDTHAEYVEAVTDWKIEQKESARKAEAEKSKLKEERDGLLKSHQERVKAFSESVDDFEDVIDAAVEKFGDKLSSAIEEAVLNSQNGAELLYELAKDHEAYARINALAPNAAARELGKLEAKIELRKSSSEEKKPEPKTITKAPKPIEPVGGGKGAAVKSLTDPNLSQAEYEAIRRAQMKKRAAW